MFDRKCKMIRMVISLVIISTLVISCASRPEQQTRAKHFFWVAKKNGNTVYLLGSIHGATQDMFPLPDVIEDAFKKSDYLVTEITLRDSFNTQKYIKKYGMYDGTDSLQAHIPQTLYKKLDQKIKKYGLSVSKFKKFKPWVIATTISFMNLAKFGFNTKGIDLYFMDKKTSKKKIGLETSEFQIKLFSESSAKIQQLLLQSALDNQTNDLTMFKNMIIYWKQGNVKAMEKLLKDNEKKEKGFEKYYKKLIDNRNITMSDKIYDFLENGKRKKYFVVVGLAHLIRKKGIISLLTNRGIRILQL